MFSCLLGPLHMNQMLFYHRHDSMLVLEINCIVGFVANYLCLALGYLCEFLHSKAGPEEIYLKRKIITMIRSLLILLGEICSPGQLKISTLTLAINMSFLILLRLNQQRAKFQPMKPPTIMACIYVANTRLCNLSLKSPVCCEQLIHTKDNQSSKARKIMCALWTMPIYIISLKGKDWYRID